MRRDTFLLTIDVDGDAFIAADGTEVARLLKEAQNQLMDGVTSGFLTDVNGNTAGSWEYV